MARRALLGMAGTLIVRRAWAAPIVLDARDNGSGVDARVGDTIEVALLENASTGYRWDTENIDARILPLIERTSREPANRMPGAPGEAVFRFRAAAAGSTILTLKRWRPWLGDESIVERFAVTIVAAV